MKKIKIRIQDGLVMARFPYKKERVELIKGCPDGRRYNSERKEWLISPTDTNINYLLNNGVESQILHDLLSVNVGKSDINVGKSNIDWGKFTPFSHQPPGCHFLLGGDKRALFWEQGTGKTLTTIKYIECRIKKSNVKKILIVCPKTVLSVWDRDLRECGHDSIILLSNFTGEKRIKALERDATFFIVNYDLLKSLKTKLILKDFDLVVFDESHFLKNHSALRSKAAYIITRDVKYVNMLTGTPMSKSDPSDLFGQFKILDESIFGKSFYSFRARYFEDIGERFSKWVFKKDKIDEVKKMINLRAQRLKKIDVLDLPQKLFQTISVEMTAEQRKYYNELAYNFYTEIENEKISTTNFLSKMMKLIQVCNGFLKVDSETTHNFKSNKIKEIKQIVDNYDGKVVIFSVFRQDIDNLEKALSKNYKVEVITGSKKNEERKQSIENFQEGDSDVIILQTSAGAAGITLTAASLCFYSTLSLNLIDYLQSQDRLHRISQKNKVTYIRMVADNSIEETILETIETKKNDVEFMQGDITRDVYSKFKEKMRIKNKKY